MAKKELTKEEIRTKAVSEAERYLNNAKETLKKSTIDMKTSMYNDVKYVKTAYGIIYNGVLLVLDAYLKIKGEKYPLDKKKRKSIEYYMDNTGHDTRLQNYLHDLYSQAHLSGYYDGVLSTGSMKSTMNLYESFVEYFKSVTK